MLSLSAGAALLAGCAGPPSPSDNGIPKEPFGTTPDGQAVDLYTLRNHNGVEARIMTYGGIVVSLKVPDKNGKLGDVVLGYDNLDSYVKNSPYFGALIGRYGNRIAKGHFTLDGVTYTLATNNYPNACTAASRDLTSGSGAPARATVPTARS
jgi:aldose 1-epimerase